MINLKQNELILINSKLKDALIDRTNNKGIVTFQNAKSEPLHRWFPYLEGFSEEFIDIVYNSDKNDISYIYEPFAGSGTVPVYSLKKGVDCLFNEINPFMAKITLLKVEVLKNLESSRQLLIDDCKTLLNLYKNDVRKLAPDKDLEQSYKNVFFPSEYFDKENYLRVLQSKSFLIKIEHNNDLSSLSKKLLWLAMTESLLNSSLLKRAGDVRFRRGKEKENIPRYLKKVEDSFQIIVKDLSLLPHINKLIEVKYIPNAKEDLKVKNFADIIITSPPYLNGTNYIRNTKLELWFDSILKEKKDLSFYRKEVVTAGINDVIKDKKLFSFKPLEDLLKNNTNWYDRRIPKMINDYFYDMKKVLINCHHALKKDRALYIDIGDSIYGGNYIPTHELLKELSIEIGFRHKETIVLRKRKSNKGGELRQVLIKLVK